MARPTKSLVHAQALVEAGFAPPQRLAELERVAARYAVSLTPEVTELIDPADPFDPIARQFIPDPKELEAGAVDPGRITPDLVRALKAAGKATYLVLHANHARELTARARAACARIVDAGIPMLSQSVLIRGVNDDAATLAALMRALVECRIKP